MPRYYVSFSFPGPTGLGIASADITVPTLVACADDLQPMYAFLAQQGYRTGVKILGFSLYAEPSNPTKPQQNPAPKPQHNTAPQHSRRRPSPRPGRS
ncbi:hypothetical protein [Couchioplanes azureus]|uniref:hypothetical protein n=1 Tax=Couchioplanes caeruleus TaxID=56438 RepID=UPI0016707B72|nr:hypothetical protein [Couchioplanes caeruleus]GGQ79659.1 hypothetical protein GCM10010166_57200 [Couchioplanes caeruleus subsp. azureus]